VTQPEPHRRRAGESTRAISDSARISSPGMMQMRTKPHSSLKVLEEHLPLPKGSYIYAIHVDGVLRYIGKGINGRMYDHMKEVRQRLTRKFKLKNVSPLFQRKLTEAVMKGAVIEEIVLADNLTSKQAYKLEHRQTTGLRRESQATLECHSAQHLYAAGVPSLHTETHQKRDKQRSLDPTYCPHETRQTRKTSDKRQDPSTRSLQSKVTR
jgi:hypothetical protein